MGKRGPAPKPTNLRILEGNPGRRAINYDEPKPKPIAPKPPTWLNKESKRIWKQLAEKLELLGLLTEVDLYDFQNLCLAAAQLRQAQTVLDEKGLIMETPSGYLQQRPEVSIVHKNMEMVAKLSAKFGLSPADRVGLGVKPKDKEKDPFEEYMYRGRKKV